MRRLLFVVIALILYGSLFPFDFHADHVPGHPWVLMMRAWPGINRFLPRDTIINVLLYIPLGATAFLAAARHFGKVGSLGFALLLGTALSTTVEFAQILDRNRIASVFDILCNSLGNAAGAALAFAYAGPLQRMLSHRRRQLQTAPDAMLLLLLFGGAQLYPLFPRLSTYALAAKLRALLHPSLSFTALLGTTMEWLCAALALEALVGRDRARRNFALLLLLLPARFLLAAPAPGWADILGAMTAAVLWMFLPHGTPGRYRAGAALVYAALVFRGLAPFHFAAQPAAFTWMPFGSALSGEWHIVALTVLRKVFLYGAAVWLLRRSGLRYTTAGALVAVPLAAVEVAQLWLPGRTPEITDPLLPLLMAYLFRGLEKEAGAKDTRAKTSAR